ncbi:hypothetical protein DRO03_09555, partial [Methanosarcinales archaeon]
VHVLDDGTGVNVSTIVMTVNSMVVTPTIISLLTSADCTVVYTPSADFGYDQLVNVTINASDLNATPNVMTTDAYLFTTVSAPGSSAPAITSSDPTSPVSDIAWATRTFSIEIDQTVNVTWLINGSEVQTNESVTAASYTNTSAEVGCWNVSAVASNGNDSVMQEWTWTVTQGAVTSIYVVDPLTSTMVIGENETFDANCYNANNYLIDDATVAWDSSNPYVGVINETTGYFEALKTGQTNITAASGGVLSDPVVVTVNGAESSGNYTEPVIDDFVNVTGTYTGDLTLKTLGNVTAKVPNGTTSGLGAMIPFKGVNVTIPLLGDGEWVRIEMSYNDSELNEYGIDETTLEMYKFNETTDKWELIRVQPYCLGDGTGDHYLWVEVEHIGIFALAGKSPAPAVDPGSGSSGSSGGSSGGSGTYPPGWGQSAPTSTATPAPTSIATPEPTVAQTEAPAPASDGAPTEASADEAPTETPTTKPPTKPTPGFGAMLTVFVIAGLLVATYLVMRRRE